MRQPDDRQVSPPALIVGDDPVNALGVARNLGREGVAVFRLGATDTGVLRSRYIRSTLQVPDIDDRDDAEFVAALQRAAQEIGGRPVLFPISDLHVLRVSRSASALEASFRLLDSGVGSTATLVNKRRFYQSLAERGVSHPSTRFPRSAQEFERDAKEIGYPVLLKPEISPLFARRFRRKGFVAHDPEALRGHLETLESTGLSVMVQEIIPGGPRRMHGCAGLRTEDATLYFCYRRIREFPAGFGCGSLMESVAPFVGRTRLFEYLEALGYRGIFDAEFKLDPRQDEYKLIEINARPWWQNTHPSISGLNIVKAAYDVAVGRPIRERDYLQGTKWIHLYNDFFAARSAGLGLTAWLRSLRGRRAFDIWAPDDVRPMLSFLSEITLRRLSKMPGIRLLWR